MPVRAPPSGEIADISSYHSRQAVLARVGCAAGRGTARTGGLGAVPAPEHIPSRDAHETPCSWKPAQMVTTN